MSTTQYYSTWSCFTQEQVKEINKEIKKTIFQKENPDKVADYAGKTGDFFIVSCWPLMELIHPWLYECQLVKRAVFGYDIYWDFHLDALNYNVYGETGKYGWHIDSTKPDIAPDVKLTCLLNLSEEPYEGGELCLVGQEKQKEFTSGMGLVLNSLIAHKVTPITKGERITLTYFAQGPGWR